MKTAINKMYYCKHFIKEVYMRDETKFLEKKERIIQTIQRKNTKKPALVLDADTYYPVMAGVAPEDVRTFDDALAVMDKVMELLDYDSAACTYMPPNICTQPMLDALGGGTFIVKDYYKMQDPAKVAIMHEDEYTLLAKDPANFIMGTLLPRRYTAFAEDKSFEEKMAGVLGAFQAGGGLQAYQPQIVEHGTHLMCTGFAQVPVDYIFVYYRELKGMLIDVKRRPQQIAEASQALFELQKPMLMANQMTATPDTTVFMPLTLPSFLSPREFEKIYWPTMKASAELQTGLGINICYSLERDWHRLYDYLKELPKTGITSFFENDDIRTVKKELGDVMAIGGGISTDLLGIGTKEECVDCVKSLVDDIGPTGLMIRPNRNMLYPTDGKPENMIAVAEYVHSL